MFLHRFGSIETPGGCALPMLSKDHAAKLCTVAHGVVQREVTQTGPLQPRISSRDTRGACKILQFVRPSKEILPNLAPVRTRIGQRNTPDSAFIALSRTRGGSVHVL